MSTVPADKPPNRGAFCLQEDTLVLKERNLPNQSNTIRIHPAISAQRNPPEGRSWDTPIPQAMLRHSGSMRPQQKPHKDDADNHNDNQPAPKPAA